MVPHGDDQESVCSFVSSVDLSVSQKSAEREEPPAVGEQVKFNFQPGQAQQSTSATPTANLFAAAFKNPPKLKHVTPPTVKNSALDGAQTRSNPVQLEKERIFEEQARQERQQRELQNRQREEREQREREAREKAQQQQEMMMQQQQQQQEQEINTSTKKVHFSEVDLERRQLSASNYNMPAVGFKAPPAAPVQSQATFTPSAPPTNPKPAPSAPRKLTQVARPKFRATSTPQTWNNGQNSSSAANLTADLDQQLRETSSKSTPFEQKKWSPSQPVEVKPFEIPDLPNPSSMQYNPPPPRQQPTQPYKPPAPPSPQYHTGNSVVMDNLNNTLGYSNQYPPQSPRISPPKQSPPPPPPNKPQNKWIPGMRADPNQFNLASKPKLPTAPPRPPSKTAFTSTDMIRGPGAMFSKFSQSLEQPEPTMQSRPSSRSGSRPDRRSGFSLRDGYDSDSGLSYNSRSPRFPRAPSPAGSYTTDNAAGFVFDKNALKGRGAKMFDRAQQRMHKYTKDHNEDYAKYKGKQTKGESGGHGQVPVLPAFDSVPSKPSLARPQRRNKELSDFNKIAGRPRPLPPVYKN